MEIHMKFSKTLTVVAMLAAGSIASAQMASGTLDGTEPTWDNPDTGSTVLTSVDVLEFTVDTTGLYTFDAFYPGDSDADEQLDGTISIFEGSFDPGMPGASVAFDDDGPGGQNTSQILGAALTAGTTYFYVQSSFTDVATSFGQPTGDWELTISGDGTASIVPAAPTAALFAGMAGFGLTRRRRSA